MKYRIEVTQQHIDKAVILGGYKGYHASCDCPIAQSLKKNYSGILVGSGKVSFTEGFFISTKKVQEFIRRFDGGLKVKPITFTCYGEKK